MGKAAERRTDRLLDTVGKSGKSPVEKIKDLLK